MIRNLLFVALTVAGVTAIVYAAWLVWVPAGMFTAGMTALIMARSIAEEPPA